MPAKKQSVDNSDMQVVVDPDDTISFAEFEQAMGLIQFVARVIVVRNANGKHSDKFCRLCQQARQLKEPCQHAAIWKLAGVNK